MKNTIKRLTVLVSVLIGMASTAQDLSNKGKEFWVGYGHHQYMEWSVTNPTSLFANSQEMVIYLSAEQTAHVTVSMAGGAWVKNYTVPANTVIVSDFIPKSGTIDARFFTFPPSYGGTGGEGAFTNKAIHIVSDVPIVAYAHIYGNTSSGATMLMPVDTWGYAYTSVNSKQDYAADCYSWMYVIAKDDNTVVEITPSVPTRYGKPANKPFTATLNKGEAYQIIGANMGGSAGYELTGTQVRSIANSAGKCYPIAVFSGSSRTYNPASCGQGGGDNDNQQLFPYQAWGKRYLTAPTSNSTSTTSFMTNTFKVVVKDPTTKVTRTGGTLGPLLPGGYYQFESNKPEYIIADKPILVGQFMTGGSPCLNAANRDGDPEMFFISPLEQGINKIGFYRNNKEIITVNYLTLIIPTAGVQSLKIDGSTSGYTTMVHPKLPGYSIVIKRWSAGKAQSWAESDSAFTAVTYGLGDAESYAYNAGTMINNLRIMGSLHNELDSTKSEHEYTCANTPVQLGVRVAYQPTKMVWQLSKLGNAISLSSDVTLTNPKAIDTVTVKGVDYYRFQLPQSYQFKDTGEYEITVVSTSPSLERCDQSEEIKFMVKVRNTPNAQFSFTHTGCIKDSVYFSASNSAANDFAISKWNWTFPDGSTSNLQNPIVKLPASGSNAITLKAISNEGCVGDTAIAITTFAPPTAALSVSALSLCEGGSVVANDQSTITGGPAINSWYWDMGSGTPVTITNNNPQTITYPTYKQYTIRHAVASSKTCISDTASSVITVFANPKPSFTYPVGCLPVNGVVQFNSTTTVPDGQAISSNAWNFGDPNASAGNLNTSSQASPSHTYAYGSYTINYKVITINGCTKDTTVKATFSVRPVLTFASLSPVCESQTGTITVARALVTNGVPGNGVYKGPATTTTGQFTPSQAGAGKHTIWYVYATNGGCTDSVSQEINVYAKPKVDFQYPLACLPASGLAAFTNAATISDGQSMTYTWDFSDTNATAANPNTSTQTNPTHNYTKPGTYNIRLSALSVNGCSADTTITATFSIKPQLGFATLAAVCESVKGTVSIAKGSVTNGVPGIGVYKGAGTDAAGNFSPSVARSGTHTIWFVFTTPGGCVDSVSQTIVVYPKPQASFTLTPDICSGGVATLTDRTTITSGSVVKWNWNLGEGSPEISYTNNSPFTRSYTTDKTYTVKLVAVSDKSCVSDTASQTLAVHPLPMADFVLPAGVCMPNGAAGFTNASIVSDNSALSYQWNFGDGSAQSTVADPSHIYAIAGSYKIQLKVTSAYGCSKDTAKTFSSFYNKPIAAFAVAPQILCQGAENSFTDQSTAPNSTLKAWSWSFADGTTSAVQNPKKKYNKAGNFDVALTVTNTIGCVSDTFKKRVVVLVQPVVDAGPSFVVPQGTLITFNPKVNDSTITFRWTPSIGLSNATVLRPTMVANANQTYTLYANDGNCEASDFLSVKILLPVKVPNAFSPNGDGINDRWEIQNLSDYPGAIVEVFNRYGQGVYRSTGYAQSWDGKVAGQVLPQGTYYYVITLKNGFQPITGSVTILQ
ncbi:PKD domain-containing protein [Flavisolibacter tropicus]|uniref:PKD domain-containing protein n=1 Tax=Flavisolibacter tropicus TaxID=1492898 RepID=UPI00082B0A1B|nr:PKD domain-containing protein [Flavisolibacter tropicus]